MLINFVNTQNIVRAVVMAGRVGVTHPNNTIHRRYLKERYYKYNPTQVQVHI